MKILAFLTFWLGLPATVDPGFYSFSFQGLDGTSISTTAFAGKKVIIVPFAGGHPDLSMLAYLDSVAVQNQDSVAVCLFPALDLDGTVSTTRLAAIRDSMHLHLTLAQPVSVRKAAGAGQLSLFQWLTAKSQNSHFDRDVEEDGQVFLISKTGVLYSIINKGVCRLVLPNAIAIYVKE